MSICQTSIFVFIFVFIYKVRNPPTFSFCIMNPMHIYDSIMITFYVTSNETVYASGIIYMIFSQCFIVSKVVRTNSWIHLNFFIHSQMIVLYRQLQTLWKTESRSKSDKYIYFKFFYISISPSVRPSAMFKGKIDFFQLLFKIEVKYFWCIFLTYENQNNFCWKRNHFMFLEKRDFLSSYLG